MSVRRRTAYGMEDQVQVSRFYSSDGLDVVSGQTVIKTKTDSDSPERGAMIVAGGVGISRNVYVGNEFHCLCRNGGSIVLGSDAVLSDLQLLSRISTDIVPFWDSRLNLGIDDLRWQNLSVNQITNNDAILIKSLSNDPSVGVHIDRLFLEGPFVVTDEAHFQSDVIVDGTTILHATTMTLQNGDFNVTGPGNVKVTVDEFIADCTTFTWTATDQTSGVNIATNGDGIPFFFGDSNSVCTFNGNLVIVKGDLQVLGTSTVIQSQTVTVRDKTLELGYLDDPDFPSSDETANGGGIVIKGDTDKFIEWFNSNDDVHPNAWGFSDSVDVAPGKYVRTDILRGRNIQDGLQIYDDSNAVMTVKQGKVGVNTDTPSISLQILSTDAVQIPAGSQEQQPTSEVVQYGMMRYNTTTHGFEGYVEGDAWSSLMGLRSTDQKTFGTVMSDDNTTNINRVRFFTDSEQRVVIDENGRLGISVLDPAVKFHVEGTDAIKICVGSSSERPLDDIASPGMVRYNTDRHAYEAYYEPGEWLPLGGLTATNEQTFITLMGDDNLTNVDRIRFFTSGIEVANFDPTGKLGLGTTSPVVTLHIEATDAFKLPVGFTSDRPEDGVAAAGMIRYNQELDRYEGLNGSSSWITLQGVVDIEQTTYISVLNDDNTEDVHRIRFFTNGLEAAVIDESGRLGVNCLQPKAALSVSGESIIGADYCAQPSVTAPPNGLLVQGKLGVGLPSDRTSVMNSADVCGSTCIGSLWAGNFAGPPDSLIVESKVGVATVSPASNFDVAGNCTIGTTYAGTFTGPPDGLIVEGRIGLGTTAPVVKLDIVATDAIRIPVGGLSDRPNTQSVGMVRYNEYRNRYEGLRLVGGLSTGTDMWVSMAGVSNDTDKTYIDTYDAVTGNSVEELYFYTNANFDSDQVPVSGLRMKVDSSGNVGIGGTAGRVLGSILDIQSPQQEQFTLRYDYENWATFWTTQKGDLQIKTYAIDNLNFGNINLIPAGLRRQVTIGDPTDIFDPQNIPNKLSVYGYMYTTQGVRFPDGSIQATSSTQSPTGVAYGNWVLEDVNASTKQMHPIIDNTRISVGTNLPTAKLTVMSVAEDEPDLPQMELRVSDQRYATFRVDDSGSLNVTAGLASDSDILLSPTGNVGISTDSAAASLHVNYDMFLQKNNSSDNTITGEGLYMRYQSFIDGSPAYGLLKSGNNSTGTQQPFRVQASQVLFNDVIDNVGISTTTPASKLSVCGNMSVGSTFGSTNTAPASGLIVESSIGAGTYAPSAGLEALAASTQHIAIKATQRDESVYGLVVSNSSVSGNVADGLRMWFSDQAVFNLEVIANSMTRPLIIQPSGGQTSIGSAGNDAQLAITQPSTATPLPVLSLTQENSAAPFVKFTGTAIAGDITRNIVLNDANVTSARIQAFAQISVTDAGGLLPTGTYYLPMYTLA